MIFLNIANLPWRYSKWETRKKVEVSPDWDAIRTFGDGRPL